MTPRRIQRKRIRGWRMPENTVYVGRPSKFGNPWTIEEHGREVAVDIFRRWIGGRMDRRSLQLVYRNYDFAVIRAMSDGRARLLHNLPMLRGKNLSCWCPLDQPCHADVLLQMANA